MSHKISSFQKLVFILAFTLLNLLFGIVSLASSAQLNDELGGVGIIDFETVPGETLFEGLAISDQFQSSHGIVFSLENGNNPVLAEVGSPATAFSGCPFFGCPDTPAPNQNIGSFFLTDDGDLSGLESEALIVTYDPPTAVASGVILDIDFDETFTIEARDENKNVIETVTIEAGDPNTGDGIATPWILFRSDADVYSIRFAGMRNDAGAFGLGFDNFGARSATFFIYLPLLMAPD